MNSIFRHTISPETKQINREYKSRCSEENAVGYKVSTI